MSPVTQRRKRTWCAKLQPVPRTCRVQMMMNVAVHVEERYPNSVFVRKAWIAPIATVFYRASKRGAGHNAEMEQYEDQRYSGQRDQQPKYQPSQRQGRLQHNSLRPHIRVVAIKRFQHALELQGNTMVTTDRAIEVLGRPRRWLFLFLLPETRIFGCVQPSMMSQMTTPKHLQQSKRKEQPVDRTEQPKVMLVAP